MNTWTSTPPNFPTKDNVRIRHFSLSLSRELNLWSWCTLQFTINIYVSSRFHFKFDCKLALVLIHRYQSIQLFKQWLGLHLYTLLVVTFFIIFIPINILHPIGISNYTISLCTPTTSAYSLCLKKPKEQLIVKRISRSLEILLFFMDRYNCHRLIVGDLIHYTLQLLILKILYSKLPILTHCTLYLSIIPLMN